MQDRRRAAFVLLAAALLLLLVDLEPVECVGSFENPHNGSPRTVTYGAGDSEFEDPFTHNDNAPCNERCYKLSFNATVINAYVTNTDFCNVNAQACPVTIRIRTSPCFACDEGYEYESQTVGDDDSANTTFALSSYCMFAQYDVAFGPNGVPENTVYSGACIDDPRFFIYATNDEFQVIGARSCCACKGTESTWVLNDYKSGHKTWPNDGQWAKHFHSELETSEGTLTSEFKAYGPTNCNSQWLAYEFVERPKRIPCGQLND
jgi:hypothetical protein